MNVSLLLTNIKLQAHSRPISLGGLDRGAEGAEMRSAKGAENDTPKASRVWEMGRGILLPSRLRGLQERHKLSQRGRENDLTAF